MSTKRRTRPRRRGLWLRTVVLLVLLLAFLVPAGTWAWIWYTARQDEHPPSDTIVVLGASQYNGNPSPVFEGRLQHAVDLYEQGVAPRIVTVGGNRPGDNYTEGGAGRDWLVENGVPRDRVAAITEGSNTLRSMRAVATLSDRQDWKSTVIVTDPWHSLRATVMASDSGIEAASSPSRSSPVVTDRETQLLYITRETASIWYYWIFGDSNGVQRNATG